MNHRNHNHHSHPFRPPHHRKHAGEEEHFDSAEISDAGESHACVSSRTLICAVAGVNLAALGGPPSLESCYLRWCGGHGCRISEGGAVWDDAGLWTRLVGFGPPNIGRLRSPSSWVSCRICRFFCQAFLSPLIAVHKITYGMLLNFKYWRVFFIIYTFDIPAYQV